MMQSVRWTAVILAAMVLGVWTPDPAAAVNSCVDCHRRMETVRSLPSWYQDQFVHWYGSVHGRKGITCDKCHRGRPDAPTREAAHEGLKPSSDPASPVYYKNLPETCGACHKGVYAQFIKSRHYMNLKNDRLAPTCTTCHGFQMDVHGVNLVQLVERCSVCHNVKQGIKPDVPERMRKIVGEIVQTEDSIKKAEDLLELAKGKGVVSAETEARMKRARIRLEKTGELWHGFHLETFRKELAEINKMADEIYAEAKSALMGK